MRPILICAACLSFVILGGCRSEVSENAGPEQMPTAEILEQTVASDEVEVSVASWEEIQAWVAMQKGKVVVIDLWSTMCLPCMKEFPNFVEFSRAYEGKVVCASVSVDFIGGPDGVPKDLVEGVTEFLTDSQSAMKNFVASDSDETVLGKVDAVSVPVSLIYDSQGKLHKRLAEGLGSGQNGAFNYESDVRGVVDQLLDMK